ncbi:hypothetical protein [uncultured Hyphomicrobium sp.]|uniref:hypothetical protein n=1 Tax=uncultured Hyphomicrobium sp. TaxID=194373 RepID=UPI0025E6D89D|nr:hypothetical protein [uncultured Hyphomicrobium sp.]
MPSDFARRGRPRGSGLDDRVQLRRIVEMIEADPGLKPTTAIKAIGVTDPSSIRRLRDKLKAEHHGETAHAASPSPARGLSAELFEARPTATPAQPDRTSGRSQTHHAGSLAEAASATVSDAQLQWFAYWCALGLSAVSSTVKAQMAMMDDFLTVPQVHSALRHQLLFNEVAKAFCPKRSDVRTTLH